MNHYQTLGLLQSAEDIVIRAAYRALTNVYHPDKNEDPEAFAKMQEINAAYAILSDFQRKAAYDSALSSSDEKIDKSDFESKKPFKEDPLSEKWEIALRFNPEIDEYYKKLEKLSWVLGFSYKIQLLETKNFKSYKDIYQKLRFSYLSKYFGSNKDIIDYAENYILTKQINAAIYLNRVIVVMGKSVTQYQLKSEMVKKYPDSARKVSEFINYINIINEKNIYNSNSATIIVKANGGSVKNKFWGRVETIIDGNKTIHSNTYDLCRYVKNVYKEKYT